jgi:hypothetical protein
MFSMAASRSHIRYNCYASQNSSKVGRIGEVLSAARNRGLDLHVLNVRSEGDFDAVFADINVC